ncbi:MAG: hemolysin family protein [Planktomarina sp.]|nr:hemolysin family protein [Planktomarina sp.]
MKLLNGTMPHIDNQIGGSDASDDPPSMDLRTLGFWERLKWAFLGHVPDLKNTGFSGIQGGNTSPGIWNLRQLRVEDVMVPKADIKSVPVTITKEDLVNVFRDSGLTRLPVYNGTLDTPSGFVHLKDIALKHGFNGSGGRLALKTMLRPLLFVPPSMPIGVLLAKMQADRIHMALVVDEYGGTDGLVTIEDLIEQVIGEIEDEHDPDEGAFWVIEKPGCYLAQAKTPLDEFQQEIGRDLSDVAEVDPEEVDTLGGLVFMLLGRVPARGEVINHPAGVEFEIIDADPRRVKRLRAHVRHDETN